MRYTLVLLFFAFSLQPARAQFQFIAGPSLTLVRNQVLGQDSPSFGFQLGVSKTIRPFKKQDKLSLSTSILFCEKGYEQFSGKPFVFNLYYLSLQTFANYLVGDKFSVHSGFEISGLLGASVINSEENYRQLDFGLVAGAEYPQHKPIRVYFQIVYGLIPMVQYYKIDATGNFHGQFKDFMNTSLTLGLKWNLTK